MDSKQPLYFDVAYPDRLSRGLIFIKWLLAIPHLVILYFLQMALSLTTFIAWFAILFAGKYPRGLWDFGMMIMRWQARVYTYTALQRDEYPPFGDEDYPVLFHMEYPERLSRGLIFIKWLLIIPHIFIFSILGFAAYVVGIIAWFAILFTGRYPKGMFNFFTGVMRWSHNISVYVMLFTDRYPPFSMEPPTEQNQLVGGSAAQPLPQSTW